jgi:hypothetical protein
MNKKRNTKDRITVDLLRFYVPIFHTGDNALQKLLDIDNLTSHEINKLEAESKLRDLAVKKIAELSGPLITREINKIIAGSHLRNSGESIFGALYVAGIDGMKKGLRHFDVDKLNKSSTNYLFQWIVTYAKKELSSLEAPFGVAPSRFQRYKKIAAVRKKLSLILGRYASNEEVLEFFHSGKADLKNMNGPVGSSLKPSQANKNITLELIAEQENYEKNLSHVDLIDPIEDKLGEKEFSNNAEVETPFIETLFYAFLEKYSFKTESKAVLISELKVVDAPEYVEEILKSLDKAKYRKYANRWKDLLSDKNGVFYEFLLSVKDDDFNQFDVGKAIESIESHSRVIDSDKYKILFNEGER